jgi:hypothetical protein
MKVEIYSYRFAEEILQHPRHSQAWNDIERVLSETPLFVYPGKSRTNSRLDVVQQVLNTFFDRRLAVDLGWEYHPLATGIVNSGLRADFRKTFDELTVQAEVQFGNMARWYSDVFKFQAAYSQGLIQLALSVIPMSSLAIRIDSNIVNFERARRELPSAELSITLPIILAGIAPDDTTPTVDISRCQFYSIQNITGRQNAANRWRIVNGYLAGTPMEEVGPASETGPMLAGADDDD